jgi:tetratricopeptide (TPR) repeat protein
MEMVVTLLQMSSNTIGRQAALFEHSLVVWLGAALEKLMGADFIDLYPAAQDGEALTLTSPLSLEEARECAERAGADFFVRGDLHFLPEGGRALEEVRIELSFADAADPELVERKAYRFGGFIASAGGDGGIDLEALEELVREVALDAAAAMGYPQEDLDLSLIPEGMTPDPAAWESFVTALRFASSDEFKLKYYRKALGEDPYFAQAYVNAGRLLIAGGDYQAALRLLLQGYHHLKGSREENGLLNLVALCSMHLGDVHGAVDLWKRIAEDEPERAEAWCNLGTAYHSLGEDEEALKFFQAAVEADGLFPLARFSLGRLYAEQGMFQAAARELQVYIKLIPGDPWAYSILGRCLLELGEVEAARFTLHKAVQLDPSGEAGHLARLDLKTL